MEIIEIIKQLSIIFILVAVLSVICNRVGIPTILAYIVSGIILGESFFKVIEINEIITTFAEIGVILIMLYVGLEFNLKKLKKVGVETIYLAIFEILLVFLLTTYFVKFLGFDYTTSVILGAIFSISSTAVIVKILDDLKKIPERAILQIISILIVEDMAAILFLTMLGSLYIIEQKALENILIMISKFLLITFTLIFLGKRFLPKFIDWLGENTSREILMLAILGISFLMAFLMHEVKFSVAIGSFIIGAIIGYSRYRSEIKQLIIPIKDIFASIFFIYVGLITNIFLIKDLVHVVIILAIIAVLAKLLTLSIGSFITGYSVYSSLVIGSLMVSRGEFSFIMAEAGLRNYLIDEVLYSIIIVSTILTIFSSIFLTKEVEKIIKTFQRFIPTSIKDYFRFISIPTITLTKRNPALKRIKTSLTLISIYVFITTVIFIISENYIKKYIFKITKISIPEYFMLLISIILSSPFLYAILKEIKSIVATIFRYTHISVPLLKSRDVFRSIRYTVYFLLVGSIFIYLSMLANAIYGFEYIIHYSLILLILASSYYYWSAITRFHKHLKKAIKDYLSSSEDMGIETDRIKILPNTIISRTRIKVKDFERLTNVKVIAIERKDNRITNPHSDEILRVGDVLIVKGRFRDIERVYLYLYGLL